MLSYGLKRLSAAAAPAAPVATSGAAFSASWTGASIDSSRVRAGAGPREQVVQTGLQGLRVSAFFENSETAATDEPIAFGQVTAQISADVYAVRFNEIALSPVIEVGSRVYVMYGMSLGGGDAISVAVGGGAAGAGGGGTVPDAKQPSAPIQAPGVAPASPASSIGGTVGGGLEKGPPAADRPPLSSSSIIVGGLVAKVNGNGTFAVLLDNDRFDLAVPREMISLSEGRSKFLSNEKFLELLEWVKSAGVDKRSDQESTSCILFHRGWRADKLYLLESADVHCLSHLNKSVRMSVLEKAEWERDNHRHRRDIIKERIKEKELRYVLTKYSGVFSACVAVLGVMSVFGWNFKNYKKQQRSFQVAVAVNTMTQQARTPRVKGAVTRLDEEQRVRQILRRLDVSHPRVVTLTGFTGCGKSVLCREAISKEKMAAVFVNIRANEDPLRTVVRALGVQNVDACGDLVDFIGEASERAKKAMHGVTPLLVFKLREGNSLMQVYNEAIALACDRRLCHIVIEIPLESLSTITEMLPRIDFVTIPNFSIMEAFRYTQHTIDPIDLIHFIQIAGTNSNDLDELIAAVQHQGATAVEYADMKLIRAMRQLQAVWSKDPSLKEVLFELSSFAFETGQKEGYDYSRLKSDALKDIVLYNPVQDAWLFRSTVLHTAARCWK